MPDARIAGAALITGVTYAVGMLALSCVARLGWEIGGRVWAML